MKEKRRKDILYIYKHILSLYKSCIKENSKGFSLVSVLVAIGLLGIAGSLGGMDPIIKLMSTRGNLSQKTKLQIQKNILLNHIRNHKIWEQTIDSHTDLKCLKPSTTPPSPKCVHTDINNVPPIPPIPIDILNPSGSKYYESSNPTKGYDENLNPCDGTACPFRWEVTVQLTCPDSVSQCDGRDTSVTVNGKFIPSITVTTPSAYNFSHSYLKDSRFYRLENEIIDFIDTQLRPFALLVDGIETQTDAIFVDVRGLEGKISALRTDLNTITAGLTLLEGLTWPTQCRCQETVSSPPVVEQPDTPPQSITNSETCETPDPDTGQCTKRCPANSQVDFRGECECKRSFKEDAGGQCVPTGCPANSRWYDYIQKCKCRADHKEVGGQCVSVNCPANSRWYVDKCECDYEYKEVGGQCVSANCPAKSYWSKSDQKCKCLGNYEEVGGQCQSRGCKGYASWDSNASQCVCLSDQYIKTSQSSCKRRCPRGEVYREGRCCKIEIPPELR